MGNGWELFVIDFETKKRRQLTSLGITLSAPAWSPVEDRFAIAMAKDYDTKIFSMSDSGKILRQITEGWNTTDGTPSFSPDGTRIAYMSGRTGKTQIYVTDIDGNNNRRLTFNDRMNETPAWSPKGDKIAYASRDRDSFLDIFVSNADGGGDSERLTYDTRNNEDPTWSPDGRFIAFSSDRSGTKKIYIMNKDGGNQRLLTTGEGIYEFPAWSPRLK
jgi:TolB protein